jgi:soluble cytochrome b562
MKEIVINKGIKKFFKSTKIVLYDDIDQLSIDQFNRINKYWMLHDNIGSSFVDIDNNHLAKIMIVADNQDKVKKEVENMRLLIYNIINGINPSLMAFACLVHSIDGKEITDYSDEGIKKILKILNNSGLTIGELKKKMKEVREKVYNELELYFPDLFHNVLSTAFWAKMKEKALKQCESIITGIDTDLSAADRFFSSLITPRSFTEGKEELRYDKNFEKNCIMLTSLSNQPVKRMSTKEYFALITHYNDSLKHGRKSDTKGRYN